MKQATVLLDTIYHDQQWLEKFGKIFFPVSVTQKQGFFLKQKIEELKPKTVIELGYGFGVSALWLESGKYVPQRHLIIDCYRTKSSFREIDLFVKKQKNIKLIENQTTQQFLAHFQQAGKKADLIFVDADNRFDGLMTDMYFASRVLSKNGRIIVRNTWNPSIRKALLFFIKNTPLELLNVDKESVWLIKNSPFFADFILKFQLRKFDFAVFKVSGSDKRSWDHFVPF